MNIKACNNQSKMLWGGSNIFICEAFKRPIISHMRTNVNELNGLLFWTILNIYENDDPSKYAWKSW